MAKTYGVGIMGAGNISAAYLRLAPLFKGLEVRAVADIVPAAAAKRAEEFGVKAQTPDELLKNSEIDVIVNLTIPSTHYKVSMDIVSAGKHAYSEKPFVLTVEEGLALRKAADERGLKVGSAPDTFLGGAHQQAREIIDSGKLGKIMSGTTHVMSRGMEHWHPNPDFFFQPGGGPVLDLGPYYITDLVHLLGPVKRLSAFTNMARTERLVTAEGPYKGTSIKVGTPTTIHGVLEFHNGAIVTIGASWDVAATATTISSSTAPMARSSCPIRTSSAVTSSPPASKAPARRSSPGPTPSASPTRTSTRPPRAPTTGALASPT